VKPTTRNKGASKDETKVETHTNVALEVLGVELVLDQLSGVEHHSQAREKLT